MKPETLATVRRGVRAIVSAHARSGSRTRYQTSDRAARLVLHLFARALSRWAAVPHAQMVWN